MSEADALAFIALVLSLAFTIPTTTWIWTRRRKDLKPGSSVTDERLARIEQAVDAIAIEIERISEGQRFTTKLLAERKEPPLPGPPPSDKRA
ncbi:MAG TPA: hypothetical protein VJ803_04505 [Gemmatimonadaceae bacterium]|jgi:hypothetical protein|nr:hypothetical protein [Gemmatimonadaceae bacterium]